MKNKKNIVFENIEAVIFDMDGVIVDTEPLHIEAYNIFFKRLNIPGDESLFHSFVGISIEDNVRHIVKNILKEDPSRIEERIEQRNSIYMDLLRNQPLKVIPEFYDLIEYLQQDNKIIALASSSPWEQIDIVTEKLAIRDKFSVLCSGHDVKKTKPAPDIYLSVIKQLNISPNNAVAIEDSITGVTAAKRAKLHCIALKNPYMDGQKLEKLSDIAINKLSEIINLVF
jgi:beta-phosphoglucomutase family hydrolase